jgi:hypothetical protein
MSVANLLTAYDPSFETTGVANWLPGNSQTQLAQSTTEAHTGTHSMGVTATANGSTISIFQTLIPVLPGVLISPSIYAWATSLNQYVQFNLVWYYSDKATIVGNTASPSLPLTQNAWTQATFPGMQAPSTAYWVQLQVLIGGNIGGNTTYLDDVALGWGNYATNMCANPGFETDLTGWSAARGYEALTQINNIAFTGLQFAQNLPIPGQFTNTLFGNSALQVATPGTKQNEGVIGPSTWMPVTATGSMSCNIFGETGTLAVQCVDQITGSIISQQVVTLNGSGWVNAQVSNLTFVSGHAYYIEILTWGPAQDLTFVVDAVMYQPEAPTPYVDGDQYGCFWTGTVEESSSYKPYQFGISEKCSFTISGVANVINPNQIFPVLGTPVLEFYISGGPPPPQGVMLSVLSPGAAMTDFGIWQGGALGNDLDPAMAYSTWNNMDVMSGAVGYNRPYMAVTPPLDQFTSTGGYNWKRAAYMALGFQWINQANGTSQIMTDAQTEWLPINGFNAITPRAFQSPRQLQIIVKPDRLNYVTNPSFETSTANWSQIGSGQTLAISSNVPTIPNSPFPPGVQSMSVTVTNSSGGGVQITINYLIPGRTYMASCWILPDGTSMGDVSGSCGTGSGTITGSMETGYGAGGYGSGPYGGVTPNTTPLTKTWQQLYFSFEATADSHVLQLAPINVTSPVYPYTWDLDAVLVEDGDILNSYFDGNFGEDALWLATGTQNLCQSFYYNQLEFARHIVTDSLNNNTPFGISYASPLYATMPTQ